MTIYDVPESKRSKALDAIARVIPTADDHRSPEWLAWRKLGIGASDVSALIGMSRFASPMSVWADKLGLSEDVPDNEYMEFGRRVEPMLAPWFADRTGLHFLYPQAQVIHPDNNHHRATLDGRAGESPNTSPADCLGVVEYKSAGEREWTEIPDAYACQVQWQMWCDEKPHAWLAALHGRKFRIYEIPRDDRAIGILVDIVDTFWNDHVLTEIPPPADGHDATSRALLAAFPESERGAEVDLSDISWTLQELADAKAAVKLAEGRKAEAENEIKARMGHAEVGLVEGEPRVRWSTVTSTRLDATALEAARPEVAGQFRTTKTYRRLTVKDKR